MDGRRYRIYDVFTEQRLTGNPLAVVLDFGGLDDAAMQAIAREFNLSETVFVSDPVDPRHRAALRIFTPGHELPFAGHPTVGTAVALADEAGEGADAEIVVLEERIGPVRCVVSRRGANRYAEFDLPRLPQPVQFEIAPDFVAAALGLGPHEIGFENHRVAVWSAGVPYVTIPVSGLDAAARAALDVPAWRGIAPRQEGGVLASAYVYCRETVGHESDFHSRMFVPGPPAFEDPATGSAAAAFAGAIVAFDQPVDGPHHVTIEQGIEMGRPSRIRLEIDVVDGGISAARIGGTAIRIAEGMLYV